MRKSYLIPFIIFCILIFNSCFSDWTGEGTLSFNFTGSNTNARYGYFVENGEYEDFRHEIHLLSVNGKFFKAGEFAGQTGTVTVPVGTYTVIVKGYGENDDIERLRSYGISEKTYTITAGKSENVPVEMNSAVEVEDWEDFIGVIGDNALEYADKPLYILISNNIYWEREIDIVQGKQITLIAETDVVISSGVSSFSGNRIFTVNDGSQLDLGVEGMPGTITITGEGTYGTKLINVINSTLRMYKGVTLTEGTDSAVYLSNESTFEMYGGTISGNTADSGGGVCVGNDGSVGIFNMYDGTITGNTGADNGGGVYVFSGTFRMYGGEITKNTASFNGGGVYAANGTFNMFGGDISGNTAETGGGVYVSTAGNSGIFNMYNGIIAGNTAKAVYEDGMYRRGGNGGGVYVGGECSFNIQSGIIVGTGGFGSHRTNIAEREGSVLFIASSTQPGVTQFGTFDDNQFTPALGDSILGTSDETIHIVNGVKRQGELTKVYRVNNADDWNAAVAAIVQRRTSGENDFVIEINDANIDGLNPNSFTFSTTLPIQVTIKGVGWSYRLGITDDGSLLRISAGQTVVLENIILAGKTDNTAPLVYVGNNATLIMEGGSFIQDNINTAGNGGGVYVDGGTFIMNEYSVVERNEASSSSGDFLNGGGVYVNSGTFTMNNGSIEDNRADSHGGGVYIGATGTFAMYGGSILRNNSDGGSDSLFVENGGTATASYYAGTPDFVSGSIATAGSDTVIRNYLSHEDTFEARIVTQGYTTLTAAINATRTLNTSEANPAVINILKDFTAAARYEIGNNSNVQLIVAAGRNYTITLAEDAAAPLFNILAGSTLILGEEHGGNLALSGGSAEFDSAGVSVEGTLIMNHTATITEFRGIYGTGGGVFVDNEGTFIMNAGTISLNEAYGGAGVFVAENGTFIMNAGEINNNTAEEDGGGVYVEGTFNMDGGEIFSNEAYNGGGVHVAAGTFTMTDGIVYGVDEQTYTNRLHEPANGAGNALFVASGGTANIFGDEYPISGTTAYVEDNTLRLQDP